MSRRIFRPTRPNRWVSDWCGRRAMAEDAENQPLDTKKREPVAPPVAVALAADAPARNAAAALAGGDSGAAPTENPAPAAEPKAPERPKSNPPPPRVEVARTERS